MGNRSYDVHRRLYDPGVNVGSTQHPRPDTAEEKGLAAPQACAASVELVRVISTEWRNRWVPGVKRVFDLVKTSLDHGPNTPLPTNQATSEIIVGTHLIPNENR